MTIWKSIEPASLLMGKLKHGSDLLEEITNVCYKEDIRIGWIEALGAVKKARLGYYNQEMREYRFIDIDRPMEITKLVGNVSLKDGEPIVHAHITLSDMEGKTYGGHLVKGTEVFACEFILQVFDGVLFERAFDKVTGLPLWAMAE